MENGRVQQAWLTGLSPGGDEHQIRAAEIQEHGMQAPIKYAFQSVPRGRRRH